MAAASDHEHELRLLRERVYGAGSTPTDTDIARLHRLEAGTDGDAGERFASPAPADTDADTDIDTTTGTGTVPEESRSPRRPPWRGVIAAAVATVLVAGVSFTAGVGVATPAEPDDFPELLLPQTEEDVIITAPGDPVAETIDLSSTRFIATVNGYDVFVSRPADAPGICAFTRVTGSTVLSGAGCSEGGPGRGSVGFGGVGGLMIHVGDVAAPGSGDPLRLSESVVAYVT